MTRVPAIVWSGWLRNLILLFIALGTAGLLASVFVQLEYARIQSPDQRFYAVARYPLYQALIPRMPGGGGDKPGTITIYNARGKRCGSTPIPMVNELVSLRWEGDKARTAVVELALSRCLP